MPKKKVTAYLPSTQDVQTFEMLWPMLNSDRNELRELSKKKQDEPLNKFKVSSINKKLIQIKEILKNEPTYDFLDLLNEENMPTNSDAVLIISQFKTAMEQFRHKYYATDGSELGLHDERNVWKTRD